MEFNEEKIEKTKIYALAVSGGVDSMVLFNFFYELKKNKDINFFVVTINHGIRGESSKNDALFVADYSEKKGIKCEIFTVDAPAYKKEKRLTLEQAARELRYQIFENILKEKRADFIVLAHQANDRAETVLMRILRGTGISGLKGIADRPGYIHPLINISREEIENYAKAKNIPFVSDETNADEEYTRNFLRHTVFPLLKSRYPKADKCINRLAEASEEADELINSLYVPAVEDGKRAYLPLSVFEMQGALVRASIMSAFKIFSISQNIEKRHIKSLVDLSQNETSTEIDMPYNIKAYKDRDRIVFYEAFCSEKFLDTFDVEKSFKFKNRIITFKPVQSIDKGVFDLDKIPENTEIRTRQNGDFFKRYKGKTKSLGDYFTDENVPVYLRDEVLLLAKGSEVLLILGMEVSDKLKIDENTKKIYKAEIRED